METIFSKINRHFAFTRKDRAGIYVLLFLIIVTIAVRTAYPFWKEQQISAEDSSAAASVSASAGVGRGKYGNAYGRGGNSSSNGYYGGHNGGYGDTAGDDYGGSGGRRSRGGRSSNGYNTDGRHDAYGSKDYSGGYSGGGRSSYTPPSYMQKKAYVVALNSADTHDLKELRGIGSAYARRIVAYREKLGGFVRKEQLREVWGIDTALYARISPQITVDASQIHKIDLNAASIDVLKRHPYLDYYLAKEIVKHREKHGKFSAVEDLLKVNLIDESTFKRIKPYLKVEA